MSTSITPTELKDKLSQKNVCLLDVRRKADFEKSPDTIEGAVWQDPENVQKWSKTLPKDHELIVYCVRGEALSASLLRMPCKKLITTSVSSKVASSVGRLTRNSR